MRTYATRACMLAAMVLVASGMPVSVSAQAPAAAAPGQTPQRPLTAIQTPVPDDQLRRLTSDEAVRLALENNLGLQVARFSPQLQDLNLAVTRGTWTPALTTRFLQNGNNSPSTGFLSGSATSTTSHQFANNVSVQQALKTGTSYSIGWDSARQTTNSILSSYPTQLNSSLALSVSQPLVRNFKVDATRNQLYVTQKNREIADVQLQQQVAVTTRSVRNALEKRTDLGQSKKSLEANDLNIKYLRNQTLPDVTAQIDYGLTGVGGTYVPRNILGTSGGDTVTPTDRSYLSVLGDLVNNAYPRWTAQVNIAYPIGHSQQEASLAQARLQYNQNLTQLKNQQLQVATQVRESARQVVTNQKRVETTRAAREFARSRLDAEQRKFAAGTSTNFLVFQAQRDLAQAANNELRAILDYQKSLIDLEAVQQVPLNGGGTATVTAAR